MRCVDRELWNGLVDDVYRVEGLLVHAPADAADEALVVEEHSLPTDDDRGVRYRTVGELESIDLVRLRVVHDRKVGVTVRGAVVVILQRREEFGRGQERSIPGLASLESEPSAQCQGIGLFGNPVLLDVFKAQAQIDEWLRRARRGR